jgi:hypothetical protein
MGTPHAKSVGQFTLVLSSDGVARLRRVKERTGRSNAGVIGALLDAPVVVRPPNADRIWFPHKLYPPIAVRLTKRQKSRLDKLVKKFKRGRGEIAEALLVQHSDVVMAA